jgi:hypothetical protein
MPEYLSDEIWFLIRLSHPRMDGRSHLLWRHDYFSDAPLLMTLMEGLHQAATSGDRPRVVEMTERDYALLAWELSVRERLITETDAFAEGLRELRVFGPSGPVTVTCDPRPLPTEYPSC